MRLIGPATRYTATTVLTSLLAIGLLTACGEEPTPTPVPTATPAPTATPTSTPPPSPALAPPKTAADYTEDEIIKSAEALFETFLEGLHATPIDTEALNSTYAEACKVADSELAMQLDQFLTLLGAAQLSLAISGVERVPGRDDAVFMVATMLIDGVPLFDPMRSLTIFENGNWVDADCTAGRALVLAPETGANQPPGAPVVTSSTPVEPTLDENPAQHTDREIAISLEWVFAESLRAVLAPQLDPKRVFGDSVYACQTLTEQRMVDAAPQAREWFATFETIEFRVVGVERVDERRA
ncbi:MAG: hypothetical protein OXE50_00525, partial [Chloroflexi bacterium]|nr:hypothetical protein [Chloroflexota bacterium]